jgi:hypothetical protein
MEMPMAVLADKFTILTLKLERGLDVKDEWNAYREAVGDLDVDELMNINLQMWNLEELISVETDLAKIGAYYLALRGMTAQRIAAKNAIAKRYGEYLEVKDYR